MDLLDSIRDIICHHADDVEVSVYRDRGILEGEDKGVVSVQYGSTDMWIGRSGHLLLKSGTVEALIHMPRFDRSPGFKHRAYNMAAFGLNHGSMEYSTPDIDLIDDVCRHVYPDIEWVSSAVGDEVTWGHTSKLEFGICPEIHGSLIYRGYVGPMDLSAFTLLNAEHARHVLRHYPDTIAQKIDDRMDELRSMKRELP
jgi:hypothetical protein